MSFLIDRPDQPNETLPVARCDVGSFAPASSNI
jgi:hypothetical protein